MQQTEANAVPVKRLEEKILVLPTECLKNADLLHQGLYTCPENALLKLVETDAQFIARYLAEEDNSFKQIIPYLIFQHADKFFLMQRSKKLNEKRLKGKFSLGIGGHINLEDLTDADSILDWAKREFEEEVNYSDQYSASFLGLINDDSNPVGRVHLGAVYLLHGSSSNISIKSEFDFGKLVSLQELEESYSQMETWSQIIVDYLHKV